MFRSHAKWLAEIGSTMNGPELKTKRSAYKTPMVSSIYSIGYNIMCFRFY